MRPNPKLDALVTRSIADLEAAMEYVREGTDKRLFRLANQIMKEAVDPSTWHVGFDAEEFDLWLAPRAWLLPGTKPVEAKAWFEIEELFDEDDAEDDTWLAGFTGASSGVAKVALFFDQQILGKAAWKRLVRTHPISVAELLEAGFRHDLTDGSFYAPVILDPEVLASGFENGTPEQAFGPLQEAVKHATAAAPIFETILEKAISGQAKIDATNQ